MQVFIVQKIIMKVFLQISPFSHTVIAVKTLVPKANLHEFYNYRLK